MLNNLFKSLFGDKSAKFLNQSQSVVAKINDLEASYQKLKSTDFPKKTQEFKERISNGESLDDLLVEAFALVRESAVRTLGVRHYDIQIVGGIALHQGRIAEMKTGEGKTLVATLPVYLNALSGKGVHVVTVNDYLARRDAEWMGKIYNFLGLSVGVNQSQLPTEEKIKAYQSDITYGTSNEYGFDYLRDNMIYSEDQKVQRSQNFALIDEVDSVLIDEARTPLVISGQSDVDVKLYGEINKLVGKLNRQEDELAEGDFYVDEKTSQVVLSEIGHENIEKVLIKSGLLKKDSNLYDPTNINLLHYVQSALKANYFFTKEKDYVVKDGLVVIIDELTGRMMPGRRWGDGIHQAIEAKEKVTIQRESKTMAGITFQNYFRMYEKLAGMTGTAMTEAEEFKFIYNLETIALPPHQAVTRIDNMDKIYRTSEERYKSVIQDVRQRYKNKQPVLIGTTSIENSEFISKLLSKEKIPHQILNAKHHEKEAHVIEQAGKPGMITIATNMAGRGTDIVLGGNVDPEIERLELEKSNKSKEKIKQLKDQWNKDHKLVVQSGGLHIIGTERHESRRIDNQLRGRSGRQGDPGSTTFYLSLEDSLMRIFASEKISMIMEKLNMPADEPIEHRWVTRSIENAQKKVEGRNFDIRKQLLEFDEVPNSQRKVLYEQRNEVLISNETDQMAKNIIHEAITNIVFEYIPEDSVEENWNIESLEARLKTDFNLTVNIRNILTAEPNIEILNLTQKIVEDAQQQYFDKEKIAGKEALRHFEKSVMLQIIDHHWREHLTALDHLRQSVVLRAYGQKDPKQEFKKEAFSMFEKLLETIKSEIARVFMMVQVKDEKAAREIEAQKQKELENVKVRTAGDDENQSIKKVSRNQICPCGSGKKYKHCHGALN